MSALSGLGDFTLWGAGCSGNGIFTPKRSMVIKNKVLRKRRKQARR